MTNPSAGDTVNPTNASAVVEMDSRQPQEIRIKSTRKRRSDPLTTSAEVPEKTQRRDLDVHSVGSRPVSPSKKINSEIRRGEDESPKVADVRLASKRPTEIHDEREPREISNTKRNKQENPATIQDATPRKIFSGRDETARLRKTIQWLEEGARRLREDLANARTELHEERRAGKIAKREMESCLREARAAEAAKYQLIVSELKARLSRPASTPEATCAMTPTASKVELMKDEHHRREISAMKKRLAEAESTIRRLKRDSLNLQTKNVCKSGNSCAEAKRLENEIKCLRASNEKLEERLRIALEAEKARANELRIQHETHEAELTGLRKSVRSETIKMMDELRGKTRQIEKLSKRLRNDDSRKRRRVEEKDDVTMRKLRENERNGQIRPAARGEKKFFADDGHTDYTREIGCDRAVTEVEVERLREVALEQQEVIEILRQAVKEKERKLEQLSNKKRKEEFYRQWLELEPVAEVDDEEDHEEGDSALSSAPSSLSPQPGGCGQWQGNGVTREAYEAVLIEIEELQSRLLNERQELTQARNQVRELEKSLQETKSTSNNKEVSMLNDKLRAAEEREVALMVELSELREQNELLEFRLLELEESPNRRDSPDHTADSGIVSPEPMHLNKDSMNKQRNRAVATVIPYTSNTSTIRTISPVPQKPPLSLQESGIFEEVDDEEEVELASRGTQTEVPAGELLQEVQRLQELRARIQERAAKVTTPVICPVDSGKISSLEDVSVDSIVQLSSYQERIRELEERLEVFEEAEENRHQEKREIKLREEELLDENYRLTERVYWLENELRNSEEKIIRISRDKKSFEDAACMTEDDLKIPHQIQEIDEGFAEKNGTDCNLNNSCSKEIQTEVFLNVDCSRCKERGMLEPQHRILIVEQAREAKESEEEESEMDSEKRPLTNVAGTVSQVLVVPEETPEERREPEAPAEPVISFSESETDKKVRQRRNRDKSREGCCTRTWSKNRANFRGDISLERINHRLVLYPEICV